MSNMVYEPNEIQQKQIMYSYFLGFSEGSRIAGWLHGVTETLGGVEFTNEQFLNMIIGKLNYDMNIELSLIGGERECNCNDGSSEDSEVEL